MPTEGQTAINKNTGQSAVFRNGSWVATPNAAPEASMRGRLGMGMGPMVQAAQTLDSMQRDPRSGQSVNPLNRDWGAAILDGINIPIPFTSGEGGQSATWSPAHTLAKKAGGDDYQAYTQAAKAYEAQLMPIMSGAAVSPSEAKRQIQASLPELGDGADNLSAKSRDRKMMLNGAAKLMGQRLPYPDVPTYGVNSSDLPQGAVDKRAAGNAALKAKSANKGGGFKIISVE